ncbi:ThiF family adenylyltransferase [Aliiroseovarius sp.]|uniref:ThiF family adenylyltransferase n=1 Tax=Aliiroseovarius sp. TaxID=1872442 RepID=UPI003BAA4604
MSLSRYARQQILPEVGAEGQARLARARVLVVGAGGLGCPVLQYLVGAGVGHVTLIDPDHVDETNLHRQPLYRMSDIGQPKVTAARAHLLAANPEVTITARHTHLTPANAPALVAEADVVVDAADSYAVSYTLSDSCLAAEAPLISASVLGQSGYVGGFCGSAPSLRAVFPAPPDSGASCATAGVFGPVVGTLGTLQAQLTLQVVLGIGAPMGHLVTVDTSTLTFGGFAFTGAAEPADPIPFIAAETLTPNDRIIELRDMAEAPTPATPDAQRQTPEEATRLTAPENGRLVLACTTGLRAWRAAEALRARGVTRLALLASP